MALDKVFSTGEILSAADTNDHLLGIWTPLDKKVLSSGEASSSIAFTNLSTVFRIFRLTIHGYCIGGDRPYLRINNDSGNSYSSRGTINNGSLTADAQIGVNDIHLVPETLSGSFMSQMTIGKFANDKNGNIIGHTQYIFNDYVFGALWNNASDLIDEVNVITQGFAPLYGVFALEGMRGV